MQRSKSITLPLFYPSGRYSSSLFPTDCCSSSTSQTNPSSSSTSPYAQMASLAFPTSLYRELWNHYLLIWYNPHWAVVSPCDQCSFWMLRNSQCSSLKVQACQSFSRSSFGEVFFRLHWWTSWGVECTQDKAPDHSGFLLWAIVVRTSPCRDSRAAYRESSRQLHLMCPAEYIESEGLNLMLIIYPQ